MFPNNFFQVAYYWGFDPSLEFFKKSVSDADARKLADALQQGVEHGDRFAIEFQNLIPILRGGNVTLEEIRDEDCMPEGRLRVRGTVGDFSDFA